METMDMLTEVVKKNGDEVAFHEPPCVIWKAEHENCKGCPYGLGCGKVIHLGLIQMMPMIYTPKDFEDFQKMHSRMMELTEMALGAKTEEALRLIPHQ